MLKLLVNNNYLSVHLIFTGIITFAWMKALAVFTIFLMIFAGFDFCKDEDSNNPTAKQELASSSPDEHQQETPCTPFCSCTRCPFSVILPESKAVLHHSTFSGDKFSAYRDAYPALVINSIWQPPKGSS